MYTVALDRPMGNPSRSEYPNAHRDIVAAEAEASEYDTLAEAVEACCGFDALVYRDEECVGEVESKGFVPADGTWGPWSAERIREWGVEIEI